MAQKYTGSEYTGMRKERRKIEKHFPFFFYLFVSPQECFTSYQKTVTECWKTPPIEKSAPHRSLSIDLHYKSIDWFPYETSSFTGTRSQILGRKYEVVSVL